MLKSFCDRCHSECSPAHSSSRRFESLAFNTVGQAVGLEILLLADKQLSTGLHVCDNCLPELLNSVIDTYAESELVRQKHHWATKMQGFVQLEGEMSRRLAEVELLEAKASDALREASEVKQVATKQHQADLERIKVLQAQVAALHHADEARLRREQAESRQRQSDEQHYPEYISNVEEREKRRKSA